jgi:hypothetical protein
MEILPLNGEEGQRPARLRALRLSVGWDKLTITTGAGDIYEVPLMHHAAVSLGRLRARHLQTLAPRPRCRHARRAAGRPGNPPALTDKAYVYFMGTGGPAPRPRRSPSATRNPAPQQHRGAQRASCEQAILVAGRPQLLALPGGETTAARASRRPGRPTPPTSPRAWPRWWAFRAGWWTTPPRERHHSYARARRECPVEVSTNSGSAPATLSRFAPAFTPHRSRPSTEISVGDYIGVDIGTANDEVVKVPGRGSGHVTAVLHQAALRQALQHPVPSSATGRGTSGEC